jgi:lathosterol oxidase
MPTNTYDFIQDAASYYLNASSTSDLQDETVWPSHVGLTLGILAVIIGQIVVVFYHFVRIKFLNPPRIQAETLNYSFLEGMVTHFSQPEGFFLLGSYLVGTWMYRLMPDSYYSFEGGVSLTQLLACLMLQDIIQTLMHYGEHELKFKWPVKCDLYKGTHKPHHKFLNPRLFDAFNGSLGDTFFMILIPLYITALTVHCNVWTYMAFGTSYSSYPTLIHSEYANPWDKVARLVGIATASDHHVHHRLFIFNYGHLFTYWDRILGTYKSPLDVKKFEKDI